MGKVGREKEEKEGTAAFGVYRDREEEEVWEGEKKGMGAGNGGGRDGGRVAGSPRSVSLSPSLSKPPQMPKFVCLVGREKRR